MSLATGVLFGLGPAISFRRANLHDALKDDSRTSSGGRGRLRTRELLVATELALAIVLLTGAGLMLKSFWRMNARPPGFAPESILAMRISLAGPQYSTWAPKVAYAEELLHRIAAAPGVEAAGVHSGNYNLAVTVQGVVLPGSPEPPIAAVRMVSRGYLRAMGVPLVKGRWPTEGESLHGVVVNESFVRSFVGDIDPIGRQIGGSFLSGTILGVVADFKGSQLDAKPSPEVYYPHQRAPGSRSMRVVVRLSGSAAAAAPAIRKLVSDIDPTQPAYELQTLQQALSDSIVPRRFNLLLLSAFAATALAMALVGIYGVMAYSVTQRTHEIGIRMALGAQRGEVVGMVFRQGMRVALVGIVFGVAAAYGLTRLMAGLLYDVKANDLPTFTSVTAMLVITALLACWAPAARASRIDPLAALRRE